MRLVGGLVLGRVVRELLEAGQAPARLGRRLRLGQRQKLRVPVRRPRERVDAEEAEHVVNAIEVEDLLDVADARAPPVEVAPAQLIPAVIGDAPVLPPLLGEGIHLEHLLRRRAAAPVEVEDGAVGPDVGAEPPHPEGDVAHQIDLLRGAVGLERLPLAEGQPLDVHEEELLAHQLVAALAPAATAARSARWSGERCSGAQRSQAGESPFSSISTRNRA